MSEGTGCRIIFWLSAFGGLILAALIALASISLAASSAAGDAAGAAERERVVNEQMHKLELERWSVVQRALDRIEQRLDKAGK